MSPPHFQAPVRHTSAKMLVRPPGSPVVRHGSPVPMRHGAKINPPSSPLPNKQAAEAVTGPARTPTLGRHARCGSASSPPLPEREYKIVTTEDLGEPPASQAIHGDVLLNPTGSNNSKGGCLISVEQIEKALAAAASQPVSMKPVVVPVVVKPPIVEQQHQQLGNATPPSRQMSQTSQHESTRSALAAAQDSVVRLHLEMQQMTSRLLEMQERNTSLRRRGLDIRQTIWSRVFEDSEILLLQTLLNAWKFVSEQERGDRAAEDFHQREESETSKYEQKLMDMQDEAAKLRKEIEETRQETRTKARTLRASHDASISRAEQLEALVSQMGEVANRVTQLSEVGNPNRHGLDQSNGSREAIASAPLAATAANGSGRVLTLASAARSSLNQLLHGLDPAMQSSVLRELHGGAAFGKAATPAVQPPKRQAAPGSPGGAMSPHFRPTPGSPGGVSPQLPQFRSAYAPRVLHNGSTPPMPPSAAAACVRSSSPGRLSPGVVGMSFMTRPTGGTAYKRIPSPISR
eukprot:gnl/TRDRNA2_/TRDRNA2_189087_c0_seq1.p1 gnl/TRDRNA2_/TRDRNA2_189087_c0~~gnl/TRDRNA2_/TRDRNA2_189087_c0_seq1.p1  ORF type:complete len:561 (-),score=90.88 gnl/TRDRNA2_/TRDRNA2_189087_c0_seq1:190-1743(-)